MPELEIVDFGQTGPWTLGHDGTAWVLMPQPGNEVLPTFQTDAIGRQQEEAARAWASRQVVEYVPDASSAKMIRLWPGWYLVRWPYGGGGRYFPPEDPLRRAIRRLLRAVPIGPIRVHD